MCNTLKNLKVKIVTNSLKTIFTNIVPKSSEDMFTILHKYLDFPGRLEQHTSFAQYILHNRKYRKEVFQHYNTMNIAHKHYNTINIAQHKVFI